MSTMHGNYKRCEIKATLRVYRIVWKKKRLFHVIQKTGGSSFRFLGVVFLVTWSKTTLLLLTIRAFQIQLGSSFKCNIIKKRFNYFGAKYIWHDL